MGDKLKIALFGPQGSGKGTQAEMLAEKYNLPVLSPGEIFRKEIKNKTELGKLADSFISGGQLVPDEITNKIVQGELAEPKYRAGFILDGYPRNMNQLVVLEKNVGLDFAIELAVSDGEVIKRLASRRVCSNCGAIYNILDKPPREEGICDLCGGRLEAREDDRPEAIGRRLAIYHQETEPVLDYYAGKKKLIEVEGFAPIEKVFKEIVEKLSKAR
jgi:adenylate kinase